MQHSVFISMIRNNITLVLEEKDTGMGPGLSQYGEMVMDKLTKYLHITVFVSAVLFTGVIFASSANVLL